jgi:NADH-quinone oxidoreductase subunit A
MENTQISEFGIILLFIVGGIVFVSLGLLTSSLLRPHRPNYEKLTPYECGEDAVGSAWGQFNVQYYVIALIFILFEVEIVFLFPWATVFGQASLIEATDGQWGWIALLEVFVFVGILVLGLAYVWAKGFLDWIKPHPIKSDFTSKIPTDLYQKVNERVYPIKKQIEKVE